MLRIWLTIAVVGSLWSATPLRAGLYNLNEAAQGPGASPAEIRALPSFPFEEELGKLLRISNDQLQSEQRQHYLDKRTELERKNRFGGLTTNEKINFSEFLIRLREYDAAIALLAPLAREERNNFMVHANLATAYQMAGQLPRAIEELEQVKAFWPREWKGWSSQQVAWYGQVETYQAKLVRLRYRESKQPGGPPDVSKLGVDDIFDVRFVGDGGQYEAGKLAADQRAKLPPDALAIVQQLLIWLPDDTRLYWLMGELLNAQGDLAGANRVFDQCSWSRRFGAKQLQEHRQIVQEALAKAAPPGNGVGDLVLGTGIQSDSSPPSGEASGWRLDRSHLLIVGSLAAVVVAVLVFLQIREVRRRRGRGG